MLVSVIIPTYNRAEFLKRALASVLSQSYRSFELLVVDDGSTDNTSKIMSSISDSRIRYFKITHSGVSSARNYGIKKSQGSLLAFLDSDDEWLEDKLKLQVEEYLKKPYALCHSDEIWIRNGKFLKQKPKHKKGGGEQFFRSLELCCISPSASIIPKYIIEELGMFREDFPACEDYDLWLKLTAKYDVCYIDKPLIVKYGGHKQLSQQHSLDYYRIKSIIYLLDNFELTEKKRLASLEVLKRKLDIYKGGLVKRGKTKELDELNRLTKHLFLAYP